jgi:hypothetical protein
MGTSEDFDIPLGGVKKKQLPWTTLPNILSERGWQLENWPTDVPLPGSGSQSCDDNKGVNGLNKRHLTLLYEATKSKDHPLKFSGIAHEPASSSGSTDAVNTSETFTPGSTVISDIGGTGAPLNDSRRRGREDETEGNQRPDKRPRLMGD